MSKKEIVEEINNVEEEVSKLLAKSFIIERRIFELF